MESRMHTQTASPAVLQDRPVDPWALLTGGSLGHFIGFAVDLLRLGVHQLRQSRVARAGSRHVATRSWPCSRPCDAGAR
jgi:hypothetical protein